MEKLNYLVVFFEGILSFVSPCILPILPIYLAILSNSNTGQEGDVRHKRFILMRNSILFVLGISTTFFILGTGIGIFRTFLMDYKRFLLMGGGVFIMIMGLFYIGDLKIPFLQRERRIHYKVKQMNPFVAYLLGFTFSFGWTPCIGPMLASVLVLASTSSALTGNLLIAIYTLGFVIPFLIVAFFSEKMLKILDKVKLHFDKIQKIGGYILIIMGLVVFANGVRTPKFVKPPSENQETVQAENQENETQQEDTKEAEEQETEGQEEAIKAPDFTLVDQYGVTHTLSDYKGKTVFLNFWATWCPPCKEEMPYIEEIYKEYGMNEEDVVILGVAFPKMGGGMNKEKSKEGIIEFLEDENYTFPVVFDESEGWELAYYYSISAFPTTFIINPEGNVEGYLQGGMKKDMMKQVIEQVRQEYQQ